MYGRARGDRLPVAARSLAADCLEALPQWRAGNHSRQWTGGVQGAKADGPPGQPARGVGRAVNRVYHDHHWPIGVMKARLFGEYGQTGGVQDCDRSRVSDRVVVVLVVAQPCQAPILLASENVDYGVNGRIQDGQQWIGHARPTVSVHPGHPPLALWEWP